MLKLLSPGDVLADMMGLKEDDDRFLVRLFFNVFVWGAVGTTIVWVSLA